MRMLAVLVLLGAATASAAPRRTVRVVSLPTRAQSGAASAEASTIASDIARAAGGELAAPAVSTEMRPMRDGLARANQLLGDGAVDEAADAYDAAILRGRRGVLALGDASADLERGVVARVGIALARGEGARARELATWLVRVDPTFTLEPSENRPKLAAELAEAMRASGALRDADLGECTPSSDLVVVVRATRADQLELRRLDGCHLGDAELVSIGSDHGAAVRAIVGIDAAATPVPARHTDGGTPLYRKTWFWVAVGAVAVGAAGATYYAESKETREVVPHW